MFRIFNKKIIAKELFTVNLDSAEVETVMQGNLFLDHPELNPNDCCVIEQTQEIQYPTYDKLEDTIREMSLIERYKHNLYQLSENEIVLNNEIVKLEEGQYLDPTTQKIITVPKPVGFLTYKWISPNWLEGSTEEEVIKEYRKIIDNYKQEILDTGYTFRGHRQKVREKDKSWLSLRREALHTKDMLEGKITAEYKLLTDRTQLTKEGWVFDTGEVEFYDILDLNDMLQEGNEWTSAIFTAEEILKANSPNLLIVKQDFLDEIAKYTTVLSFISKN